MRGEKVAMRKISFIWAAIVSLQADSLTSAENETYREASYALLSKSALASTAVVIALAAGYGLWSWWNKKPAKKEIVEQQSAPAPKSTDTTNAGQISGASSAKQPEPEKPTLATSGAVAPAQTPESPIGKPDENLISGSPDIKEDAGQPKPGSSESRDPENLSKTDVQQELAESKKLSASQEREIREKAEEKKGKKAFEQFQQLAEKKRKNLAAARDAYKKQYSNG